MYVPNVGDKPGIKYNVFGKALQTREKKSGIRFKSIKKWREAQSTPYIDISVDKNFSNDILISILK